MNITSGVFQLFSPGTGCTTVSCLFNGFFNELAEACRNFFGGRISDSYLIRLNINKNVEKR